MFKIITAYPVIKDKPNLKHYFLSLSNDYIFIADFWEILIYKHYTNITDQRK